MIKVNKTQIVRDILGKNPIASNKDILAIAKRDHGVTIKLNSLYMIKHHLRKSNDPVTVVTKISKVKKVKKPSRVDNMISSIKSAKQLIEKIGSENAVMLIKELK